MANTEKVGILTHIDDDGNKTELYPVVKTDSTLTESGTPADAAATGEAIAEATNIAKGRNRARVFATTAAMESWLKDAANKGVCIVGDNLYIVQVDVPDWWVSEVLTTADSTTGYYYKIAQLETQKVDLSNYLPKSGGQITGNITGNANNFTIAASGDIKSDKWGGSWLSAKLSNYDVAVVDNATNVADLKSRFGKVCTTITDWNAITESGFYMASNASNAPTTGWFMGIVIVHNSNYIIQELWQFTGGDANTLCAIYIRQKNTSWREWNKIPLGSLEGVTSNIQTQLNAKLSKSGGTLTGKLTTQQVENSTSYVIGADKNSYSTAPFVASAPYSSNTASRAGYGFHNHGLNGTFLYLENNGDLKKADNDGTFHKIMDSGHFSVSGTTLNITL